MINLLTLIGQIIRLFFTIVKSILPLCFLIPQDSFDLLKNIMQQTTILSSIPWINKLLFLIASGFSIFVSRKFASLFKMSSKSKSILSFVVFIISIWMFGQIWFWIILAVLIFLIISYNIYAICKKLRGGENYV